MTQARQRFNIPDEIELLVLPSNASLARAWVMEDPEVPTDRFLSEDAAILDYVDAVHAWLDQKDAEVIGRWLGLEVLHLDLWHISTWFAENGARREWAITSTFSEEFKYCVDESLQHMPDSSYPDPAPFFQ